MPSANPHFKLRIPNELLEAIKEIAERDRRTSTSLINQAVEIFVRTEGLSVPPNIVDRAKALSKKTRQPVNALLMDCIEAGLEKAEENWIVDGGPVSDESLGADLAGLTPAQIKTLATLLDKVSAARKPSAKKK